MNHIGHKPSYEMENFKYLFILSTLFISHGSFSRAQPVRDSTHVLREAVISATRETGASSTRMGTFSIPREVIRTTPALLGEGDPVKTIQLLPGVRGGMEGLSGIMVRGGSPDQNLVLLDGIPLYNAEHALGLLSIFQTEAVGRVDVYKGSFPARYGGRASGIIDIRTAEADTGKTSGTIGLGVLADKLYFETPIRKLYSSLSVNARVMHTFLLEGLVKVKKLPANYYFHDLGAKLETWPGASSKIRIEAYHGRDILHYRDVTEEEGHRLEQNTGIGWGNSLLSAGWTCSPGRGLTCNTVLALTRYRMATSYKDIESWDNQVPPGNEIESMESSSGMTELTVRTDLSCLSVPGHEIRFGASKVHHTSVPEEDEKGKGKRLYGNELSVYAEDSFKIGNFLDFNPGIRFTLIIAEGRVIPSPEPRINLKATLCPGLYSKVAYSRMSQYMHLVSPAMISLPVDIWVPVTGKIDPIKADQVSAGFSYAGPHGWELSLEGYWKMMRGITEYKDDTLFFHDSDSWEDDIVQGEGRARGLEFMASKESGRTTGWIGYTLSWSERRIPDGSIDDGAWFPYRYDSRHAVSVVANHKINSRWHLSATWSYSGGGAVTVPGESRHRGDYRLPPSHCLNLGAGLHRRRRHGEETWNFFIYNAYNRKNPNLVLYNPAEEGGGVRCLTLLPLIPSVSYTFKV
ncbi:MAG: TonB-dependent receptor [Bacteroidales bacterium]|nr:TonB-dependent receptor [Bacteroidales bacterium]